MENTGFDRDRARRRNRFQVFRALPSENFSREQCTIMGRGKNRAKKEATSKAEKREEIGKAVENWWSFINRIMLTTRGSEAR